MHLNIKPQSKQSDYSGDVTFRPLHSTSNEFNDLRLNLKKWYWQSTINKRKNNNSAWLSIRKQSGCIFGYRNMA